MAQQAKIEAQLFELEGMQDIQVGLELARISEDVQMSVDEPRPIDAKQRALDKFVRVLRSFYHLQRDVSLTNCPSGKRPPPTERRKGGAGLVI